MKYVQTLPGADTNSDHNLLVANICTRSKKIIQFLKGKPKLDLEKLYAQIRSMTDSAGCPRIKTQCNQM
jgi:hypothetical protein